MMLTYEQVEEVINFYDPIGLLKIGAPKDEYKSEIEDILKRRNLGNTLLRAEEIKVIFEYWFFPGCITLELARKISEDLPLSEEDDS